MRLDRYLVEHGYARSRTQAETLIKSALVKVNGVTVTKTAKLVRDNDTIDLKKSNAYVSRAAEKLDYALKTFQIEVASRDCIDVGSSTGGFSQILLNRGAQMVVGIDVGHDQLSQEVAAWSNHVNLEGFNARNLNSETFRNGLNSLLGREEAEVLLSDFSPTVATVDVSFISVKYLLENIVKMLEPNFDLIVLVKPQFEVGPEKISRGIVKTSTDAEAALADVREFAENLGLRVLNQDTSPILGSEGNTEYLLHLQSDDPTRKA